MTTPLPMGDDGTVHDFGSGTLYVGDCRDGLRWMKEEGIKVQMCVTSPPYWGLRDYGVDGQLGLEESPEAYVQNMVEVFRLVRNVLADDGTVWLNLGDSYSGSGINDGTKSPGLSKAATRGEPTKRPGANRWNCPLKPKDLIGVPWRVAFALQADGWWLRSDIIWHKPSCMPESVTDRPTRSHEYIFLLTKSQKYFYENDAIKEPSAYPDDDRKARSFEHHKHTEKANYMASGKPAYPMRNKRSVWSVSNIGYSEAHFATFPPDLIKPCILAGSRPGDIILDPFMGSGTTAMVAESLGRKWVGCELNPQYVNLIQQRLKQPNMIGGMV